MRMTSLDLAFAGGVTTLCSHLRREGAHGRRGMRPHDRREHAADAIVREKCIESIAAWLGSARSMWRSSRKADRVGTPRRHTLTRSPPRRG